MADGWDPTQYDRFKAERTAPFHDLLTLVQAVPGGRVVDLGCGTGALTAELHRATHATQTVGIDNSDAMLAEAAAVAGDGLSFRSADIGAFDGKAERFDVVFSNAALQWVPDHRSMLARWASAVADGGQLAVQMPANADHPSHVVSSELAPDPPDPVAVNVLRPEDYAALLHDLGFAEQHVRLQVYGHTLPSSAHVVEWVKGTSLTRFKTTMDPSAYDEFVAEYSRRLLATIGDHSPYFYAFKRILFWARR